MSDELVEEFGIYPSTTREIFQEDVQSALDFLDMAQQDIEIISFRFGLPDKNFQYRRVVANRFGVTQEYIKQLELLVIKEFKQHSK